MSVTDEQVRILMRERSKGASLEVAGAKAGMSRQTASKYEKSGQLPSEGGRVRTWRTRENPFEDVWPQIEQVLRDAPGVEAKIVFELLQREHPGRFTEGQLRTLQRQVRRWRALCGDDGAREVFFPQVHRPGEALQTDFTATKEFRLTVSGVPYAPLICHSVLPYSGWRWVTLTRSESTQGLINAVQEALFRLGAVPEWHQTDNSTGATHRVGSGAREFNDDYFQAMTHLGMKPRTTAVGKKEQNGSVEAHNGALKRLVEQHLKLRGHRDFASEVEFEQWLRDIVVVTNKARAERVRDEHEVMKPLRVERLKTYKECRVVVTRNATVRLKENVYSVPPRLMGEWIDARVYDDRIEFCFAGQLIQTRRRLLGQRQFDVDYRHIIWSLVRKPGAMERYCYRECLFPTLTFRQAYQVLSEKTPGTRGDAEYLRVLHLAASTFESEVEAAIRLLLEAAKVPDVISIRELITSEPRHSIHLEAHEVELSEFDVLLSEGVS